METSREYLEIYIIKDDKTRKINVMNIYANNQTLIYSTSKAEKELISQISGVNEEDILKMHITQRYETLVDSNYSIIWVSRNGIELNVNILIGRDVSKPTYKTIIRKLSEIDELSDESWLAIYNRAQTQNGLGFEYINKKQSKKSLSQMMDIVHIFCREKIGDLPECDAISLKEYREFDLAKLLKYDKNDSNSMQSRRSGVVVITPDSCIRQNNNREIHTNQIEDILSNLYGNEYAESVYTTESNKTNSIFVLMSNEMYFLTLIYLPQKINEFQYKEIMRLLEEIKQTRDSMNLGKSTKFILESKYGKEPGREISLELEELQTYLQEEHDVIIDNNIVGLPKKVQDASHSIVTEEQMADFFDPSRRISSNVINATETISKLGLIAINNMKNCFNIREKENGR